MPAFSKIVGIFLPLAMAVTADGANYLRTVHKNDEGKQRKLQLAANVLNGVIDTFMPLVTDKIQSTLAENYDPLYVGNETTIEMGEVDLLGNNGVVDCTGSASMTFGLGTITGLSSINFNQMELVPGSEQLEVSFLGLNGATWGGSWLVNATFDKGLTAQTSATLKADACGMPLEQTVTGSTTINNPSLQFSVNVAGETSNIVLIASSSQITNAQVEQLDLNVGSIDAGLGTFGAVQRDLSQSFDAWLLNELVDQVEPMVMNAINSVLTEQMPFAL